ncbi:adenosylcobinamide-GDP ribazoletransferase [Aestuariibius sp. 2305UL40-4]|uniref:adenosylcobinamide-GDP ribazoletransferase n=1 Tax=Aestuariibius violaceus TaxID=3234132 RepID=UPI00345E1E69
MKGSDLIELADIGRAFGLLTRIPVPVDGDRAMARGARAVWAWPLVGLTLGLTAGLIGAAAHTIWASPLLAAAATMATLALLSGAMHEDGLADCADGFFGASDKTRRLEIMKDSRIGAFGVLALILTSLLRLAALALLFEAGNALTAITAAAILSRATMVPLMNGLPPARPNGLSSAVGRPPRETALTALGLATLTTLILTGLPALAALAIATLTALACAAIARSKIGGQTGDVLGATQQIVDLAVLLTLAAL